MEPSALKSEVIEVIARLKEEEIQARSRGNTDMTSGICLARVLIEEALRAAYGDIPHTIEAEIVRDINNNH